MATLFKVTLHPISLISLIILCGSPYTLLVNCTEFEVGGHDGWVVPMSGDNDQMYNLWASQNRFKVGDTLRFKYEKDSVTVVSEEEYKNCRSSRPLFFSDNGDTVFKFERAGMFYFISGDSGHCARGQKMIIKVLELHAQAQSRAQPAPAPTPQSENVNVTKPHSSSKAADEISIITASALYVLSLFVLQLYA